MIYLYYTPRGVIGTGEEGKRQIDDAVDEALKTMWKPEEKPDTFQGLFNEDKNITIDEFLTSLNVEEEIVPEQSSNLGKGIKQQIEEFNGTYTYSMLTKEKFNEWLKELGYEAEDSTT